MTPQTCQTGGPVCWLGNNPSPPRPVARDSGGRSLDFKVPWFNFLCSPHPPPQPQSSYLITTKRGRSLSRIVGGLGETVYLKDFTQPQSLAHSKPSRNGSELCQEGACNSQYYLWAGLGTGGESSSEALWSRLWAWGRSPAPPLNQLGWASSKQGCLAPQFPHL